MLNNCRKSTSGSPGSDDSCRSQLEHAHTRRQREVRTAGIEFENLGSVVPDNHIGLTPESEAKRRSGGSRIGYNGHYEIPFEAIYVTASCEEIRHEAGLSGALCGSNHWRLESA